MKINVFVKVVIGSLILVAVGSCRKEPGEGGRSSIKGKVKVKDYNSEFTILIDEYYAQGENVYITYGDNTTVGENVKTSYDGSFEFPYLRKGKYKVFVVSKDTTSPGLTADVSVIKEVEITAKKQVVQLQDIVIIN